MSQKLVIHNEIVRVKGRVKVITIKKDEFEKFLQLRKLRILDKEYEALMPPVDSLEKNTIDVNGLATLVQQYVSIMISGSGSTTQTSKAEMVLTTQSGNVVFPYSSSITMNSQGVALFMQIFQESGNYTFQYFYVGFDTTNSSYTVSYLELYVSALAYSPNPQVSGAINIYYTDTVRIAYSNSSFSKTSDSFLFIVWLIEFQNIPAYLVFFTPIFQNSYTIIPETTAKNTSALVYFNNGNCNFTCGGNCSSDKLGQFLTYVQNNNVILEFPLASPLGAGVTNIEVLFCTTTSIINIPTISGSVSSTLTPPVSGATFYFAIVTITITYQAS